LSNYYLELPGMHLFPPERELLRMLAHSAEHAFGPSPTIVNIGIAAAYGAASMHCLRAGSEKAQILGIDIEEQGEPPLTLGRWTAYAIGDSATIEWIDDTSIHVLFVDGDHTYQGVKRDIEAWADRVAIGGAMAFHDYGFRDGPGFEHCRGVKRAVDEWFESAVGWKWMGDAVSIRWFKRVG
jgi:hypothetical protein